MKYFIRFLIAFLLVYGAFAIKILNVKEDQTPIFAARTGDKSKGTLTKGSKLSLLKRGKDRSFVQTKTGLKGWIENSMVEYVKSGKGDIYHLSEQEVHGWLDNPSAVYILDNSGLNTDALPLTRNFNEEVFEFEDRETMERGNDEN